MTISTATQSSTSVVFNPARHLDFDPTTVQRLTLTEIGMDPSVAPTDFACTYPFKLLSEEGVKLVRAELIKKEIQQNCRFVTKRNPYALRGIWRYSSFINDLWKSKEVTDAISKAVGYPLLLNPLDWDLGHVNVQIDPNRPSEFNPPYATPQHLEELIPPEHVVSAKKAATTAYFAKFNKNFTTNHYNNNFVAEEHDGFDDAKTFLDFWHVDNYPFVCVLMLSDSKDFEGGETVIRNNRGGIIKLKYPAAGYAAIIQGAYVIHCARRALNAAERIAMLPTYIPADPLAKEVSVLDAAKGGSNLQELFQQWSTYRFDRLAQQTNIYREQLKATIASDSYNKQDVMAACDQLITYVNHTKEQLSWPE